MREKRAALSDSQLVGQWLEKNFTCEDEGGVWSPKDQSRELVYSDGEQFENRLLEVIERATDRAVGSLELEQSITDFPSRYHLSSRRANLLRPIQHLLGGRVLEVGAGCGALSRFLGELRAEVWALEGSVRRAQICAARCRDLSNVRVFRSNVEEFDPPVRFDAVTLVGVVEYSRMFLSGEDKVGRMLEMCSGLLNEEGVLIIAIENQLGMKYFAGAPEDHLGRPFCGINDCYSNEGPVTYGRVELEKLIQRSGFRSCQFLYPFPDYKFPRVVLHASACSFPEINIASLIRTCTAEDQSIPYDRIFAEEMAWPVAVRNDLVGSVANSFLAVASRKENDAPRVSPERVAYIYSESRRRCYARQTVLVAASGQVHVRRSYLYPEATPADESYRHQLNDELLLTGNLWIHRLFPVVNRIGWTLEDIAAWARPWVEYLQRAAAGHDGGQAMLPPHFLDCTPYNLLEQPDGSLQPFDLEWVAREPVPLKWVVFRGLFLSMARIRTTAEPGLLPSRGMVDLCRLVMSRLAIEVSPREIEALIEQEAVLQGVIAGQDQAVRLGWRSAKLAAVRRSDDLPELLGAGRADEALDRKDPQIASLFTQLREREQAIASLQLKLAETERASTMVAVGLNNYRKRLSHDLAVYRGQRAWKLMLLARQAYILANRRGWRGKAEMLNCFSKFVLGRPVNLREAELELPDVAAYLPPPSVAPEANSTAEELTVKYDVVILAIVDFDFRFQRPQQIAIQFACSGHRVLWVSPTRCFPPDSEKAYELTFLRENLWEVHLRGRLPDAYRDRLEPGHAAELFGSLRTLCQDLAVSESCALLQLPFWRQLGLSLRSEFGSRLVYDCMDEWAKFPNMGAFNLSEEKSLVRECDLLVVTGYTLLERFRKEGLKPLLVRNAADFDFYERARPTSALDAIAKPIVGFFGGIAAWVDLGLVYKVARLRPDYSFVLIGQVFGHDTSRLEALPNVHLLGSRHYSELPGYLMGFDVCMIPFVLNEVTKAADPVKLYEYFSLGKPVVATDLAEIARCEEMVYLAHDAADFAAKVDAALREDDPQLRKRRIEFAKANTWRARVEDIDCEIRQSFPMVSILIVTYDSAQFIEPCLGAILRNTKYPRYEVVIVDNNSTDNTRDLVRRFTEIDGRIHLVTLPTNRGFAAANNAAAKRACGDYFVLLNADTMVSPGWLGRLIRHFERDPEIGLLSPTTNFAGNELKVNFDYGNSAEMETFAMRLARSNAGLRTPIPMVPLFCAVVPKTIWETAGELDEGFEVGMFEDDDFSLRVVRAGYKVMMAEDCFVHHFGQGSFAKLPPKRYEQVFQENLRRFENKWATHWVAHKTRPGVLPPLADRRFSPAEFGQAGARKKEP